MPNFYYFDRYAYLRSKRPIDAYAYLVVEQLIDEDGWPSEARAPGVVSLGIHGDND